MEASALIYSDATVPPVLWVVFVILLLLSAFFSASETAYSSLNIVRITNYAENGKKSAAKALKVHQNFDNTLSSILIGNNIVNQCFSSHRECSLYNSFYLFLINVFVFIV